MSYKQLVQGPIGTSKDGKKTPGGSIKNLRIVRDPKGSPIETQKRDTILLGMRKGREQGAPVQEDMTEETTAPGMNMKEEEEGEEETTVLMREIAGDTLAMIDEESAQGP